jgi:hypothetical protein
MDSLKIDMDLFSRSQNTYGDIVEAAMDFAKRIEALGDMLYELSWGANHHGMEMLDIHGQEFGNIISDYARHIHRILDKTVFPILFKYHGKDRFPLLTELHENMEFLQKGAFSRERSYEIAVESASKIEGFLQDEYTKIRDMRGFFRGVVDGMEMTPVEKKQL